LKKKIYLNMALLTIITLLLVSAVLCFVFYNLYSTSIHEEMQQRTDIFRTDDSETAISSLKNTAPEDMRVTVVAPNGTVIFDNVSNAETMGNHKDREEIQQAGKTGFGESKRYSDTLDEQTYYYAVKLHDGYILRTAKTTHSIFVVFERALPFVIVIILLTTIAGYLVASQLTKRILRPINDFNFGSKLSSPYDELVPFIRAIENQQEQIDRQLDEIESRTKAINAIVENMNEGAVLLNEGGSILSANKSALTIFGAGGNMAGKDILELFRDTLLIEKTRAALLGKRDETSIERSGRDYTVYFSPVPGNGAILFFLDTTERAKSEKLRREFSANVSHELKTPLTSILGYAEMLENGMAREEDCPAFAQKIKEEAQRLIVLVEDIMLLSELDEKAPNELFVNTDLFKILEHTSEVLALKAQEAEVTVKIVNTCASGIAIPANPSMLSELVYNLMDNAIKYNKPGGSVTVHVAEIDGQIALTVEDDGIGIPENAQDRVFERFYRAEKSRSKTTGGTGLGLAIVKHIAIIHSAEVTLYSKEGEGTNIRVLFPLNIR
jgi:two-component system phosphate regulon sensor histidine kinase PhoR